MVESCSLSDCEHEASRPQHIGKGRTATCEALAYVTGCDTLKKQKERKTVLRIRASVLTIVLTRIVRFDERQYA